MRQADWELRRYERLKPMIVEVIRSHGSYAIFNMTTGEFNVFQSPEEHIRYDCKCILKGTPRVAIVPWDGGFRIELDSEESILKREFYINEQFEPIYEYIIDDHPELQFNPEKFANALAEALRKTMREE